MSKVLVVYGSRYGSTEKISNKIAGILKEKGMDTTVVNLRTIKKTKKPAKPSPSKT